MMRSTCLGEMRNCRAMTEGLTPASNAARISLRWPAERLGGCLCALDLGAAPRLDSGAFGDRERFAAVVDGRGRRRCASALTARNSVSRSVSSRSVSEAGKSHGIRNRVGVLSPPESSGCETGFSATLSDENRSSVRSVRRWRGMASRISVLQHSRQYAASIALRHGARTNSILRRPTTPTFCSIVGYVHGRPVGLARRTDRLANLRRVAQHEVGGDRGDAVRTTKRGFEVDAFEVAELIPEFPQDGDLRHVRLHYIAPRGRKRADMF